MADSASASSTIAELREFASFTEAEQLYIERSLEVALGRRERFRLWAGRRRENTAALRAQAAAYRDLPALREAIAAEPLSGGTQDFIAPLLRLAVLDLEQEQLTSFSAFRFLYERLLGARARPWLPAVFCGAAALPQIPPARRKTLLRSLSEAAATAPAWSEREPCFYPEIVEAEAA